MPAPSSAERARQPRAQKEADAGIDHCPAKRQARDGTQKRLRGVNPQPREGSLSDHLDIRGFFAFGAIRAGKRYALVFRKALEAS